MGKARVKRVPLYLPTHIEIDLTRGYRTKVSLDCPADVLARTWHATKESRTVYAATNDRSGDKPTVVLLHRVLMRVADARQDVDHADGDPLNNMFSNLRICTRRQNLANIGARSGSYRGVNWAKHRSKWCARLSWYVDGKQMCKNLGYFTDEVEAAKAWDAAALASGLYDPTYLRLNFPRV